MTGDEARARTRDWPSVWMVQFTATRPSSTDAARTYAQTLSVTVVCRTAERAIDLVQRKYVGAVIYAVQHKGGRDQHVIVDDDATAEGDGG